MSLVEQICCDTANEFVQRLLSLQSESDGRPFWERGPWVYRGQANAEWPLVPRALRVNSVLWMQRLSSRAHAMELGSPIDAGRAASS